MILRPTKKDFGEEDEKSIYALLQKFPSREEVYLTDELKSYLDTMIFIVLVKNKWVDREGTSYEEDDLVQEVYLHSGRIFQNIWRRMKDPENPIQSLYNYLFRTIQNRMWDYKRKQDPINYVEDMESLENPDELVGSLYNFGKSAYGISVENEIQDEIHNKILRIHFRLAGQPLLACYWLRDMFLERYQISFEDLFPFLHLTFEERSFIFHYTDVRIRTVLHDLKKEYRLAQTIFK